MADDDLARAKLTAEVERAQYEAEKARHEAEKARLGIPGPESDLDEKKRDAETRAAIAKAERSITEDTLGQFMALVPDFSDVSRGELTTSGDEGLFSSALALRALEGAAHEVAKAIKASLGDNLRVLVTTDHDLITSDAAYFEVKDGLAELIAASDVLLAQPDDDRQRDLVEVAGIGSVAVALAGLVPSALSLFSANRSLAGRPIAGDDLLAATRVASALAEGDRGAVVLLDDFRTIPRGHLHELVQRLAQKRRELVVKKVSLLSDGPVDQTRVALFDVLIAAVDQFSTTARAVPSGGRRSPLTHAVMREVLHDASVPFVVLIKGCAGSSAQLVNDRPLWFEDKFSTVASSGISFTVVKASTGQVWGGGIRTATRVINGRMGSTVSVESVLTPEFQ